jgi:CheY-like chemotaxis protein
VADTVSSEPTAFAPLKILVVDRYPDAARTLSLLLNTMGHDAMFAEEEFDALAMALRFHPEKSACENRSQRLRQMSVAYASRVVPRPIAAPHCCKRVSKFLSAAFGAGIAICI